MYEVISRASLDGVVGGKGPGTDPAKGKPGGAGAPPDAGSPPAPGGPPAGSGCEQLLQAITILINLFAVLGRGGPAPKQPPATA